MSDQANNHLPSSSRKKVFRMIIPCFPTFNVYSTVAKCTTALGPLMVATVVGRMEGWQVEVIDENNYHRRGPRAKDGKPDHMVLQDVRKADVAAFYGGLTSTIPRLYEVARFYKNQGVLTVAGGQHFVEDNIVEGLHHGIDYIVKGEGEDVIKELLNALFLSPGEDGVDAVRNLAYLKNGSLFETPHDGPIADLDKLPLPDFTLLHHAKINIYPVSWSRGCGMNCEFCTVKGKMRCPSPDYAFNQITTTFERLNAKRFFIVDDLFGQKREFALELCERLRKYQEKMGVRFWLTVQIRLDRAKDVELLCAMRQAGVRIVAIGYESPIEEELEAMNKKLKSDEMIALTDVFHKMGFLVHGMFIFGYPAKEGNSKLSLAIEEHVRLYWKFIKKARIDTIQILLPVPLPGTELTHRLTKAGRIFPHKIIGWEYYDGNFPLFTPDSPLTAQGIQRAVTKLMKRFYRFGYMFYIGLNILFFPAMIFSLFDLGNAWRKWRRGWRNNIWRFVGWMLMTKWGAAFNRDPFLAKLDHIEHER